jgi:hypothetical protein
VLQGKKIAYKTGGSFSHTTDKVAYTPEMKNATVELRATGAVKIKKQKNYQLKK